MRERRVTWMHLKCFLEILNHTEVKKKSSVCVNKTERRDWKYLFQSSGGEVQHLSFLWYFQKTNDSQSERANRSQPQRLSVGVSLCSLSVCPSSLLPFSCSLPLFASHPERSSPPGAARKVNCQIPSVIVLERVCVCVFMLDRLGRFVRKVNR